MKKKRTKAKAPPRPACVIISYETFKTKRAEKAKRSALVLRRRTAFVGSILEGELH